MNTYVRILKGLSSLCCPDDSETGYGESGESLPFSESRFVFCDFPLAQDQAREKVADGYERRDDDGYLKFMLGEIGQSVVAEAHGQVADSEIEQDARNEDG